MLDERIAIIGSGGMGTALGKMLGEGGYEVLMWAYEPEVAHEINTAHRNSMFLEGHSLPETVRATSICPPSNAVIRGAVPVKGTYSKEVSANFQMILATACPMLFVPVEANLILPGFCLAALLRSFMLLNGLSFRTATRKGVR